MNAEEMRVELESFVNQGLEQGWCGWPPKELSSDHPQSANACYATSTTDMLLGGVGQYAPFMARMLPWLTQMFELQESSRDAGVGFSNAALAPGLGANRPFLRSCW